VRAAFPGLLWAKLSSFADNGDALALAAREGGADAACLSGRFLGMTPNLKTLVPELGTMAAYGGRWALPITCRALALARKAVGPDFPLIGTNGAWTGQDAARLILAGASAVQMTSAVWRGGFGVLAEARDDLQAWIDGTGLPLSSLVGRAADALTAYTDQPRRPGRWRDLSPDASW
jgi:dihydroorotate dehydrogenase